jgi:hypothetical protein
LKWWFGVVEENCFNGGVKDPISQKDRQEPLERAMTHLLAFLNQKIDDFGVVIFQVLLVELILRGQAKSHQTLPFMSEILSRIRDRRTLEKLIDIYM